MVRIIFTFILIGGIYLCCIINLPFQYYYCCEGSSNLNAQNIFVSVSRILAKLHLSYFQKTEEKVSKKEKNDYVGLSRIVFNLSHNYPTKGCSKLMPASMSFQIAYFAHFIIL